MPRFKLRTLLIVLAIGPPLVGWLLRPVNTFQIKNPNNRGGDAILVRLNSDRLRANNLTRQDVMRATTPSSLVGRVGPPPPTGVVFDAAIAPELNAVRALDQCENIVVKANDNGQIIRLKDVADLEVLCGRITNGHSTSN